MTADVSSRLSESRRGSTSRRAPRPETVRHGLVAAAVAGALLLAAGCASAASAGPAAASASSATGALAPGATGSLEGGPFVASYLALANSGDHRLGADFARLDGPDRDKLAAAQGDLRDMAAAEHLFDQDLAAIVFPPATEAVAHALVDANQIRATLATEAASATSLAELDLGEQRMVAADGPVGQAIATIRSQLGLPAATDLS